MNQHESTPMNRRDFISKSSLASTGLWLASQLPAAAGAGRGRIRWTKHPDTGLISAVQCDGQDLALSRPGIGVLDAGLRIHGGATGDEICLGSARPAARLGPLHAKLQHRLLSDELGEHLLEAEASIRNESDQPVQVETTLLSSLQPGADLNQQQIYIPLSAAGGFRDSRFAALGVKQFLEDCHQKIGSENFACHYLEPMASFPAERTTRALLLAPVVDIFHPKRSWRVALFSRSDQAARFRHTGEGDKGGVWEMGRTITVPPRQSCKLRGCLYLHRGDASQAWRAYHRFGHHEDHPVVEWTREFKVHYYDFLSSALGKNGRRGDGYDADLRLFREFRVGMATQHGYYPHLGDYIQPDRKSWLAMLGDKRGAAKMSFEIMRKRIKATRGAGTKAAIYLHPVLLDDAGPVYKKMSDSILVDDQGKQVRFPWQGPDTQGKNWRASMASAPWREHMLQQAQWIMEILDPDAIVVDETFAGLGYDHHADRAGPMSLGSIDFYRKLRTLVRSFGADRAVFSSDCSMAPFVHWFDGECGDHAYGGLLGRPSYTQEPVRFLAALGDKPWRPCAWHFNKRWDAQMKLAHQVGAGVGVSNGWGEDTGLTRLPLKTKTRMLADIATICQPLPKPE